MHTEDGTPLEVRLESVRHEHDVHGIEQLCIALIDISETKRAQREVAELNRDLDRRVAQRTAALQLLHDVATMANSAESSEAAIRAALQRVCQYNGWRFGYAYLRSADDPETLLLACASGAASPDRYVEFHALSQTLEIRIGEGQAGRVCSTGNAEFTTDLSRALSIERAHLAESLGIRVSAAFPIQIGDQVVGVLEFFSDEPVQLDPQLLDAMSDVGTQLGRVVERGQAVLALRTREAHYRILVETAGSAMVGLTPDHAIVEWNREAERIFGWSRDEVLGKNYFEIILPKDSHQAVAENIQRELCGRPTFDFENPVTCRNGIVRTISWNAARLLDSAEQPMGIIAIGRDITEQKRTEKMLRKSQKRLALALSAGGLGS